MAEEKKPTGLLKHVGELKSHLLTYFYISETFVIFLFAVALLIFVLIKAPILARIGAEIILWSSPFWIPYLLFFSWWETYIQAIRARFLAGNEMILLEIKIPRDIDKSPRAMELVFAGFHYGGGESTFIARWIDGKTRPYFSFELVSIEGRISFLVWTRKAFRHLIEAQIYAQYPEVEVVEADDYTKGVRYIPGVNNLSGCNLKLSKDDVIPIKTYIDYELDKDPKEEHKVDPLAHILEFLGTMGPGEQFWMQFIIRVNKDEVLKEGSLFAWENRWARDAKKKVADIRKDSSTKAKYFDPVKQKEVETEGFPNPTPSQRQLIEAIERSMGKLTFDVGARIVYIGRADAFRGINIGAMVPLMRHFNSANLNSLGVTGWTMGFDYPWEDYSGIRETFFKKELVRRYQQRIFFYPEFSWKQWLMMLPTKEPYFVMTAEELATVYHFPSRVIQTPGVSRIPAKKAEAPPNLPV